ncbi:MAG: hypothetical protein WCO63_09220, partial [Bacteroidota bacterium]
KLSYLAQNYETNPVYPIHPCKKSYLTYQSKAIFSNKLQCDSSNNRDRTCILINFGNPKLIHLAQNYEPNPVYPIHP